MFEEKESNSTTATIGTTSTTILPANPNRIALLIRNTNTDTTKIISIHEGNMPAVAGSGIVLNYGDAFPESDSEGYRCWRGAIQAVCAGANGTISIYERTE